ncbi:hypothetical protein A3K86_03855 [Photobacterium jeanii]|uniref:HPt domain-containing protein n=1 Tax=Photobacterium jeanii TaxID=858640 RepID=A0A178KLD4_9GAMM|nr:Hpt domain-containing protein [Photobacterium jeanii]OAN18061.1 hypothetical protein A3K86_03855 [Photobacterium jeanii]PST92267.1 Hpt domain-containing protein [Photobacterium jeanii]
MINYAAFSESMDNDEDMMSMIVELYSAEHGDDVARIKELYANNDMETLFQTVHSLKGVLLTLCEEQATMQLEAIEVLCKNGNKPAAPMIDQVLVEIEKVNQQVTTLPIAN